jgi:predicted CXXCH cytochrome family protein
MARRPLVAAGLGVALLVAGGAAAWVLSQGDDTPAGPPSTGVVAQRTWEGFYRPDPDRIPSAHATRPGRPWGDFLGSEACRECHAKEFSGWRDSFHSRTLYDAEPRTLIGDFSGKVVFDDPKYPYRVQPVRSGGRTEMRIVRNPRATVPEDTYGAGLPPQTTGTFQVLHAFGNRRHQPYVTRAADGGHWVLPVYWNGVTNSYQWDGWRPYVASCAACHVTGILTSDRPVAPEQAIKMTSPQRWNVAPQDERWAEGAVGCEACHGPGRGHVEAVRRMGDAAYRAYLAGGGEPTIYDPGKDTPERRMQQCDQCHDFFTENTITWWPRPKGYERDPIRQPIVPPDAQFWPDGTHMSPCTAGTVLRGSKMGKAGVECRDCHDAHGNAHWAELTLSIEDNALCLRCHEKDTSRAFADAAAVLRHTRHAAGSPGSRCVECHMPRDKRFSNGIHIMSLKIHSHAMTIPTGDEDRRGGPEPSCNTCHVDKDSAWTREELKKWKAPPAPGK